MRRLAGAIAVATALALLAAGCSSSDHGSNASGTTTTEDPTSGGPTTSRPLGSSPPPIVAGLRIEVLSSQPDRVSGDDARIRVSPAPNGSTSDLRVVVDGRDVTRSLATVDGHLEGVITGLIEGNNTVTATAGTDKVVQRIRAWPLAGPVVSGPHQPLLACSTEANGLGPATDADCAAPTKVTWEYVTHDRKVKPLPDLTTAPDDLAYSTIGGVDVPLYVRHETGVINRSIYEVSSIDATPGDRDPTGPGWNHRLIYRYSGTCGTTFGQGSPGAEVDVPDLLRDGYAVATGSFNDFDVQCNDVLSAETTMMVKERIIEEFGVPAFTIGEGAAGGAAQLHLQVQDYPGLVDGVIASSPFPDIASVLSGATDCGLLLHYFATPGGRALTPAQRKAIAGHASADTCANWQRTLGGILDPTDGCDPAIPAAKIYDPIRNRSGLRCTFQDANANQLGLDASTKHARRPLDNVGIQYGLEALNAGTIDIDQFIALNAAIGGYDPDGAIVAKREQADDDTIMNAYETGRVSMGGGEQLSVPILDIDVYDDPSGAIADRLRPFSLRDRLTRRGETDAAPGLRIWTDTPGRHDVVGAIAVMDRWLTALRTDTAGGALADVLTRTRPDQAQDRCTVPGDPSPTPGSDTYDEGKPCAKAFPVAGDPRTAAGAPRSNEVLKCTLKPVDPSDYEVPISADDLDRLRSVFPTGVCDWSMGGAGETVPANPDRSYEDAESPGQSA